MKKAYIIIIGDEVLNGLTLDRNSNFLAYHLNEAGLNVHKITVINDEKETIKATFKEALDNSDVVISTGGLGPTKDDITKATLAEIFDCELMFNSTARSYVEEYFQQRNLSIDKLNEGHAYLPSIATPLKNLQGTAPGILIEENNKIAISLPGVPAEMQYLTREEVIPYLKDQLNLPPTQHRHILTVGIREVKLAKMLKDFEDELPNDISLAYLPSWGRVKLRLTGRGYIKEKFEKQIQPFIQKVHDTIGEFIYGYDDQALEEVVGGLLRDQNATLSTAESCTGGYLGHLITNISGSSEYFQGGIISYSNKVKMLELGVKEKTLTTHGAVSKETVEEMVVGARKRLGTDYAIATSGIAGPSGGSTEKPVGTVWIAVGDKEKTISHCFQFFKDRFKNIHLSAIFGLDMLRRLILFEEVRYKDKNEENSLP